MVYLCNSLLPAPQATLSLPSCSQNVLHALYPHKLILMYKPIVNTIDNNNNNNNDNNKNDADNGSEAVDIFCMNI